MITIRNKLTDQQEELLYDKLQRCKRRIHEIELTNDRKYREEWRRLTKLIKWIQHELNLNE
jgi:hypothetical protein